VLVAILVVLAGVAALAVWGISQQVRTRVLDATLQSTTVISSLVVDRSITYNDIRNGIHPQNRAQLDADVVLLKARELLLGLRVWELTGGRIVYADPDQSDSGDTLAAGTLSRARRGRPFAVAAVDARYGDTLKVYYPYDANGDGAMDVSAEVTLHEQEVDESISRSTDILYGGAGIALLLAVLGILQVRRRQLVQDHAAAHDALTGLGNRVLLRHRAGVLLPGVTEADPAALLLIDLNGFKGVNDTLGHGAGDELLVAIAAAIANCCRPDDTPIRLGGDEFAVLLPHTDAGAALDQAQRVRRAVRQPVQISGFTVEIDASIGVAGAPRHHRDLSGLLHCADVAMYQAKRAGGGVAAYDPARDVQTDRNVTLVPELRRALQDGQLELHYQPIVRVNGGVSEVEALLRWRHPRRGLLDAGDFLPSVARTSLDRPLTAWALGEAAARCAAWRAAGHELRVAVNVCGRTLVDPTLPAMVRDAAATAGVPISALRLEVAEADLSGDPDPVPALAALVAAGIPVALDDVGGGYPVLTRLAGGGPDILKIDPALVAGVTRNEIARVAVAGLVGFAGRLGITVVAEGVESDEAWRAVTGLGCDAVQGYAVCPPMPGDELTAWLAVRATAHPGLPSPGSDARRPLPDPSPVREGTVS
jgi:diguanylate cyclase (GGDEF)-like protein